MKCVCPISEELTQVEETRFSRDSWTIVKCPKTDFVFLANPPEYVQLESDFSWEKTAEAETTRRLKEEPLLYRWSGFTKSVRRFLFPKRNAFFAITRKVVQHMKPGQPLQFLDVGCGWGNLLEDMHGRFNRLGRRIIPNGIEISRELAGISEKKITALGGKLVSASAVEGADQFDAESMDVIILSSFLEHECQPLTLMRKLHPILAPEGVVILKVPNFASWNRVVRGPKWCGFRFPDHVNYFTPKTLRKLVQSANFTVAQQNLMHRFPFSDSMYAVLKKAD